MIKKLTAWLLLAILLCSLLGLTVAFDRFFALFKYRSANLFFRKRETEMLDLLRAGKCDDAVAVGMKSKDSPHCRVILSALECRENFSDALSAAAQLEINHLRRGISLLDTAGTASPMFGILGTVLGIINTFGVLNASGVDNPTAATAGLGEALITTAAGLVAALLCLFPLNFLISQLQHRTRDLEQFALRVESAYKAGLSQ